jgi:uncharacterized protein YaeQ
MRDVLQRFANLSVILLVPADSKGLEGLAQRNMHLHASVQEDQLWLGTDQQTVLVELRQWQ